MNKEAQLFTVFLSLVVTLKPRDARSKPREVADRRRLVLVALDEAHARARAIEWLEVIQAKPEHLAIEFAHGHRDATAVRLADGGEPIFVSLEETGVRVV